MPCQFSACYSPSCSTPSRNQAPTGWCWALDLWGHSLPGDVFFLKIRLSWRGGFVTESRTVVHRRNYTQNEWIGLLYTVHTPSHSQSILRPSPLSLVSAATDKKTRPDDMDVLWILKSKTMERMNDWMNERSNELLVHCAWAGASPSSSGRRLKGRFGNWSFVFALLRTKWISLY